MDTKELLDDIICDVKTDNVWVYVNPLTGKHCKTSTTHVLAAFRTRESGMSWEPNSKTLQKNVCYEVIWDEMISIANKEAGGKYVIL